MLPQVQVAVISAYAGWISAFIGITFIVEGHVALPTRSRTPHEVNKILGAKLYMK